MRYLKMVDISQTSSSIMTTARLTHQAKPTDTPHTARHASMAACRAPRSLPWRDDLPDDLCAWLASGQLRSAYFWEHAHDMRAVGSRFSPTQIHLTQHVGKCEAWAVGSDHSGPTSHIEPSSIFIMEDCTWRASSSRIRRL